MKNCKNCKHWEAQDEWCVGHGLDLGKCSNIPMFWDATQWSADFEGRVIVDKYKDVKAFAQDGSDYSAYVLTKPDFGCVSHEERLPPT